MKSKRRFHKTMEKTSSKKSPHRPPLLKQLSELESEVADLFHLSLSNQPHNNTEPLSFEDVFQRIDFVKKLWAAEVNTSPEQRTSEELKAVKERIVELESSFSKWYAARGEEAPRNNVDEDTGSVCSSCTRRLFAKDADDRKHESEGSVSLPGDSHKNADVDSVGDSSTRRLVVMDGDGGRHESEFSVSPPGDTPVSMQENLLLKGERGVDDMNMEEAVVVMRPKRGGIWRRCGVFCSGVIVGAIGIVMWLSSLDFSQEQVFLHLPPT